MKKVTIRDVVFEIEGSSIVVQHPMNERPFLRPPRTVKHDLSIIGIGIVSVTDSVLIDNNLSYAQAMIGGDRYYYLTEVMRQIGLLPNGVKYIFHGDQNRWSCNIRDGVTVRCGGMSILVSWPFFLSNDNLISDAPKELRRVFKNITGVALKKTMTDSDKTKAAAAILRGGIKKQSLLTFIYNETN